MASAWGNSWGVAWGNSWGGTTAPIVAPIVSFLADGGAGIQVGKRRKAIYRRFRLEDVTAAEIREVAQDLRSEARQDPQAIEDQVDALAQDLAALRRIDRLSDAVADLSRAIEFAVAQRLKAEAMDEDEAAALLLN